jgi:hypothetical protein
MSGKKPAKKVARAPLPGREAPSPPARALDGDTVEALLRDWEASGPLLDYHHTRNGAAMMQAALVYLEAGAPPPPLIREWMVGAFQRALAASHSVDVADALELLSHSRTRTGRLGGARQHERETTRLMLERIALEIAHKKNGETDKRIAERVAKRFNRSGASAYRTWCAWRKVNRQG